MDCEKVLSGMRGGWPVGLALCFFRNQACIYVCRMGSPSDPGQTKPRFSCSKLALDKFDSC